MKKSHPLLDLPAETAARVVARKYLRVAVRAADRLGGEEGAGAIRALRIALRRLRYSLKVYRPHLKGVATKKDRRRLRKIAEAAAPARDLEAQIQRLRPAPGEWNAVEAVGRDWMLRRLEERMAPAEDELRAALEKRLSRVQGRMEGRLASYLVHVDPDDLRPSPPARWVVADLADEAASRLEAELDRVHGVEDQEEAHQARIEARRLRYLLDPFRPESESAGEVVRRLRGLQDLLGEMQDGDVMRATVTTEIDALEPDDKAVRAGLEALLAQIRSRAEAVFAEVETGWLRGASTDFFAAVHALTAELRGPGGGPDFEIERKFLLRGMPPLPEGAEEVSIEQGWLPGERLLERVRRVTSPAGERWYRTVKLGTGVRRAEIEEETTPDTFAALWALTEGRRVRKTRFRVLDAGRLWEIDRFPDLDLVLAEVELDSPDAEVVLPAWLEPLVEREVTGEAEYVNVNLAR